MASYLPPRHARHSLMFSGLPPVEYPQGAAAHVSGSQTEYWRREELANLCANWLMGVFGCPSIPKALPTDLSNFRPKPLKEFIAHILHRLQADSAVVVCALYYLDRLKEANQDLTSKSGHALFFAALVVAGKVLPDISYNNKSLAETTEGMFPTRNTNHLEREFLKNLNWAIRPPDVATAREFEAYVRLRYRAGPTPWLAPSRRHRGESMPARTSGTREHDYPCLPPAELRGPRMEVASALRPQRATARPPIRTDTAALMDAHRRPNNTPRSLPALIRTGYDSDYSSVTPSPVTPEDYRDHRARTEKPCQRLHSAPQAGDRSYVLIAGDAAFGSVAPRGQRGARVEDTYPRRVR